MYLNKENVGERGMKDLGMHFWISILVSLSWSERTYGNFGLFQFRAIMVSEILKCPKIYLSELFNDQYFKHAWTVSENQRFCVADFATLSDERRSRSKFFPLFIWMKESCVRKFEGLERSKLLGISKTKTWAHSHLASVIFVTDVESKPRLVQVNVRENNYALTMICWYECREVEEWCEAIRTFVPSPTLGLRCARINVLSLTCDLFRTVS